MLIGNKISELRKQANMTLGQLAAMSGLSASYLSEIETGKKMPSYEKLQHICDSLSITLSDFFSEKADVDPIPRYFREFYYKHKDLTEDQLNALSKFISDFIK